MLWLRECPYFDQGLIRPLATANNNVVLFCDECSSVFCQPDDIETEASVEPHEPDWAACGDHVKPGTTRWATMDDLKKTGWDTLEWHDDPIDRVRS